MSLGYTLMMTGRGTGKTTAICKAAKEIDAVVLCHNHKEAQRLQREFGVRAVSTEDPDRLRGLSKPFLIDTAAAGEYIARVESRAEKLDSQLEDARAIIVSQEGQIQTLRFHIEVLKRPRSWWQRLWGKY